MRPARLLAALLVMGAMDWALYAMASAKTPPMLVYEEGADTVSFFGPKTVRIVHGARPDGGVHSCQYDLPENGNMYSGRDVESAFRDPVVQAELHARHSYASPDTGNVRDGVTGADRAQWVSSCASGCATEPPAMKQLHQILRVVMVNARLVCP
jgi:hypothetical protein